MFAMRKLQNFVAATLSERFISQGIYSFVFSIEEREGEGEKEKEILTCRKPETRTRAKPSISFEIKVLKLMTGFQKFAEFYNGMSNDSLPLYTNFYSSLRI